MKSKGVLRDILVACIIEGIFQIIRYVFSLELEFTLWFLLSLMCFLLALATLTIYRNKEKPIKELSRDFEACIQDFEKFFSISNSAILPNPFNDEPKLWKYIVKAFEGLLSSWFSNLRKRFKRVKSRNDIEELLDLSIEFQEILSNYLILANIFKKLTKTNKVSKDIIDHFNLKFSSEFNTTFRPDFIHYLKKLRKEIPNQLDLKNDIDQAPILD